MSVQEYLDNIKSMIDELKAMSTSLGLANTGDEYKIISELFTYKFLNDKLIYDFNNRDDKDESFEDFVDFADADTAKMKENHLIDNLFQKQNEENFHEIFDKAFEEVSDMNKDIYSIETASGKKKPLFEPLSVYIRDEDKELELAKRAINILAKYKFNGIYEGGFDYFSSVFEYLITDYNKDSGKYAEYFTPLFAGNIMADILYDDTPVSNVTCYDPSAGSGTLVLAMANKIGTNNCSIYTQDISQKSTQFLRINLILNKLSHSLANVIEGNTLVNPQHLVDNTLKKFDYIVSNPPFNMDFSAEIKSLESDRYNRFFAGLPNIPSKKKDKMAIYQTFMQHILSSLNDTGKAAIVVPTGFITASTGIPKKIREKLINENWLRGVISLPSNIFATTGTNVSVIFVDKTRTDDNILLMDASNLGEKISLEDGQRTILSEDETTKIVNYFKKRIEEDNFSILVTKDEVKNKSYSFSASQYFKVSIKYVELTEKDFNDKFDEYKDNLNKYFSLSNELETQIKAILGELKYEKH